MNSEQRKSVLDWEVDLSYVKGRIYQQLINKQDLALDHLKKSLTIPEELKKKQKIAQTHYFMEKVYADMDQLKPDTESYQKCLSILIEFNEYHRTSYTLLHLILIFLEMNIDQNVSRYFQQLEDLSKKSGNRIINLHYKLGKAIILKSSRRAKYKIEKLFIDIFKTLK